MKNDFIEIFSSDIIKQLKKNFWLILLGSIAGALIAFAIAWFLITPTYQSSTSFYVNNRNTQTSSGGPNFSSSDINAAQSLVDTYIVILQKYPTLDAVNQACSLPYSEAQLKSMISAKAENNTEIFTVTVTATDPLEAQKIANSIADILPQKIADVVEGASVRVVAEGKLNPNQVAPSYKKYAIFGFIIGLLLMLVFVLVRYFSDKKIHDENFVQEIPGDVPLLAAIPDLLGDRKKGYGYGYGYKEAGSKKDRKSAHVKGEARLLCDNVNFEGTEAYKLLRSNILFALTDKEGCSVFGITSTVRGEAKSTTAINLAYSFAETGKRVLLIEGDMRLPVISDRLQLKAKPGLSNILAGFCGIKEALQTSKQRSNWYVITSGDVPPNPAELLESNNMGKLLEVCKNSFDHIIIDLPPVNLVSDALSVSKYLDGIVLIAREEYTEMPLLLDTVQKIEFSKVNLLGLVLTHSSQSKKTKYGSGKYNKNYK